MAWNNDPLNFIAQLENDLTDKQKKIAIDMLSGVVSQAPVDSGALRANNTLSVGSVDRSTNNSGDPIAKGKAALKGLVPYSTVYIANSLPYAPIVEYGGYPNPPKKGKGKTVNGFSKQAPTGFYSVTFQQVSDKYK